MLELVTYSGESLIIDRGTKVRLSIPFPITVDSTDGIPASVSYPFDLPDDDGGINRRLIEYSPLIDEARKIRRVPVMVRFAGSEFDSGFIICTGSSPKFRCTLVCAPFTVDLGETLLDKLAAFVTPIALGNTPAEIAAAAVTRNTKQYPETEVVFPTIFAPDFYGGANEEFNGLLNRYVGGTIPVNDIVKEFQTGDPVEGDYLTNEDSLYPMFFAPWILQKIFESNGYKVYGEIFADTFFRRLLIGAQKAADKGRYESHITAVREGGFYDDFTDHRKLKFTSLENGADITINTDNHHQIQFVGKGYYEFLFTGTFQYDSGVDNLIIEVMYGTETVKYFQWFNGVGTGKTTQSIACSFWYNGESMGNDWFSIACNKNFIPIAGSLSIKGTSQEMLNRYDGAIQPGKYFPDVTAANMVNAIKMQTGIGIFYDKVTRTVEILTANTVLSSNKHLDITDWVLDLERNQEEPIGLIIDYKRKSDKFPYINSIGGHYRNPYDIPAVKANTELVIDNTLSVLRPTDVDGTLHWLPAGTCMTSVKLQGRTYDEHMPEMEPIISTYREKEGLVVPYYADGGRSTHFSAGNDMPLLCLQWHGLQPSKLGTLYPYASASGKSPAGDDLTGYSLQMDTDRGVYKRYLSGLMNLKQNNATVKASLMLDVDRLMQILKLFKPTVVGEEAPARKVSIRSVEMIPASLDVELSLNGIEAAELVLTQQVYS